MMQVSGPARGRLDALKNGFMASLRGRVAALRDTFKADQVELAALRNAAHQLAGTSPMFGFVEIGTAASEIESTIGEAIAVGRDLNANERRRLGELIRHIETSARDVSCSVG